MFQQYGYSRVTIVSMRLKVHWSPVMFCNATKLLQRRRHAHRGTFSRHSSATHGLEFCCLPRLRAVNVIQKQSLDAAYQRYLQSAGPSLFHHAFHYTRAYSYTVAQNDHTFMCDFSWELGSGCAACGLEGLASKISFTSTVKHIGQESGGELVYRHFGPRTLRTFQTSDLPNFGPRTLRHVLWAPSALYLRGWIA